MNEGAVLFINDPKVNPDQIENDLKIKETNLLNEDIENKSNMKVLGVLNQVSCGFKGGRRRIRIQISKDNWENVSKK